MVMQLPTFVTFVVAVICVALAAFYIYTKNSFGYWKKRNVSSLRPTFPFGDLAKLFLGRTSMAEILQDLYNSSDKPFVGLYSMFKPILLLRDVQLIKHVLVNDFPTFVDRGVYVDEKRDPLSGHLFSIRGDKWRKLRAKLSPTFSTGKLKVMFPMFMECSDRLEVYLDDQVKSGCPIDSRELLARYATDIIASVAFGIDVDCINNPDNEYREMGRRVFAPTFKNGVRNLLTFFFPELAKFIKIRSAESCVENFMFGIVKSNMEYREKNNVVRKDFFQMLLQLRNEGKIGLDENWDGQFKETKIKNLSLDEIVAQVFVFYIAGFETTSTTMSFCLYELAKNADIQNKVRDEVNEVISRHNGKINFESINEMKYLDMCVNETLRMYPPVPLLNRETNSEYTIPGTDIKVESEILFFIPVFAIHHDPTYYPKPEEFDPERFENPKKVAKLPFYPFGDGPRICVGMRMGLLQTKVGLAVMLRNTSYELSANTPRKLKYDPKNIVLGPTERISLVATKV